MSCYFVLTKEEYEEVKHVVDGREGVKVHDIYIEESDHPRQPSGCFVYVIFNCKDDGEKLINLVRLTLKEASGLLLKEGYPDLES